METVRFSTIYYLGLSCLITHDRSVPVIAIFAKFDKVVKEKNFKMGGSRLDRGEIEKLAKEDAEKAVQDLCIRPLEKLTGTTVPHITVSSECFPFVPTFRF